jgi:hypothetical protein
MNLQDWFGPVLTIVGLIFVVVELRGSNKKNQYDFLTTARDIFQNRKQNPNYQKIFTEIEQQFKAIPHLSDETAFLLQQMRFLNAMDERVFNGQMKIVHEMVNCYGDIAELLVLKDIDARVIFAKWHLMIIRELYLIEPYIYLKNIRSGGRWGQRALRMAELAKKFNDLSPIHHEPVYLLENSGQNDTFYGAIYRPRRRFVPIIQLRFFNFGTFSRRVQRCQQRQLNNLKKAYEAGLSCSLTGQNYQPLSSYEPRNQKNWSQKWRDWLQDSAFERLAEIENVQLPEDSGARLDELLKLSDHWDFRRKGNKNRWEVNNKNAVIAQSDAVFCAARALGLVDSSLPQGRDFDLLIIPGGGRLSNLYRTRYAAELLSIKNLLSKKGKIVGLCGFRDLSQDEKFLAREYYGVGGAVTELDLMRASFERVLNIRDWEKVRAGGSGYQRFGVWRGSAENGRECWLIEAPSTDLSRRANTADTFEFLVKTVPMPDGSRDLMVTSQIYVLYQHLEAVRSYAEKRKDIFETVGLPPTQMPAMQNINSQANYLQELRATLQALKRLIG